MTKQELKAELLLYNRFLYGEVENTHLVNEYINAMPFKPRITIEEVVDFAYNLFEVSPHSRTLMSINETNKKGERAYNNSRKIAKIYRAQNQIVKYVLGNNILNYSNINVYKRLFGFRPSRSTELVRGIHAKTSYVDDKLYEKIAKFIESGVIDWSLHRDNKTAEYLQ